MRALNQIVQITLVNVRTMPQRPGPSLVVVIGIAGVVGVLATLGVAFGVFALLRKRSRSGN